MVSYISEMWNLAVQGELQGILFFASIYTLLVCGYSTIYQFRIRQWPSIDGQLLESGIEKFGYGSPSEQEYQVHALYEYQVNGVSYCGTRVSSWIMIASGFMKFLLKRQINKIQKSDSGLVKVFFNPKKPQKSYLIKPTPWGLVVTALLAITPAIIYLFKYHI